MLESIRTFSASPLGKAVFILVLVAFGSGFWYYGNPFSTGPETSWAVRVGDQDVAPAVVRNDYERELNQIRAQTGGQFGDEQAKAIGLPDMVVTRIVNRTLLDLAAADLNLVASDDLVRSTILQNPAFHGPGGAFSRDVYAQTLRMSGLTERQYEAIVRHDLQRNQLVGSLAAGVSVPRSMVDALYRHQNERRVAEVVHVPDAEAGAVVQPTEQELVAYHAEHADRFTAPEYRELTAVLLRVEDLAKEVAVPDDEIQQAYRDRASEYAIPERRTLQQMVFATREEAEQAHAEIVDGAAFVRVAEEKGGLSADAVDIGEVTRHEMLPQLADVGFALAEGEVSAPVQSPLGWHLIKVTAIAPAEEKPLEQVREQIAAEIAQEKAADSLYRVGNDLQDALGGGDTLEEAAARLNLPLVQIPAVDAQGLDRDGNKVADVPDQVIATAFTINAGEESFLTDFDTRGSFIVRVDQIVPPAVRPLERVREQVAAEIIAERRVEAARIRAEGLAEAVHAGDDLSARAAAEGLAVETTAPFARTGENGPELPAPLIEALFAAGQGEPVVVRGEGGTYVARVTEVVPADPGAAPDRVSTLTEELQASIGADLIIQYLNALRQRYPVAVNPQVMDQLF